MKHLVLSTIIILALPALAAADGAYKWKDSDGTTHYGNNPPKNAANVEQVSEMGFSRYSGSKVLERYQPLLKSSVKQPDLPAIPIVDEETPEEPKPPIADKVEEPEQQVTPEQETPKPTEPDSFIATPEAPPAPAQ